MKKGFVREVVVYENHFKEFRRTIDRDALKKLYQVLTLVMKVEIVPAKFLRAVRGRKGLYEIRSEYEGNIYRVFCCFDEDNLVVLFNGFHKKRQKTPVDVLDKAESLMIMYFKQKREFENER
ncbi:MAG: type II toxin-antitoxin system RelE/ParE family toxin [Bacteroidales bacterium]|nr:type II toxin-antitoxin system RelE/ParE family toxin [Bacteroidales bacterium]